MSASDQTADCQTVTRLARELTDWLTQKALPTWLSCGTDFEKGECYEAIDVLTREPVSVPRRARVVPRQIYSFLAGADLGWSGPAGEMAGNLQAWYLDRYFTEEGFAVGAVGIDNRVTDGVFDLYNQVFALFGFAQVAKTLPSLKNESVDRATNLLNFLIDHYRHPEAGFREANPDRRPLCSNPHMHLFEACLAWEAISDDPAWSELADEIAELALTRFIDPINGGLREFFDLDWTPMPDDTGRVMEPGHQFEWAWLLTRWGSSRKDAGALIAARRLYDIGWTYGIDESRGVTFMSLNDDFSVRDPLARLWGQTEWIKAAVGLVRVSTGPERAAYLSDIPDAVRALQIFFEGVPDGLWRDKMKQDGTFVEEAAPASSLYHIVCAIAELNEFVNSA
ncbi:AGE family epimerase/isomerase [Roseibium aggregatum]|uniref:AGE family epimerase/isomerase n=1 Tax=Roseibium aggregatum TaxID=187304 RepID=A0A939EDW0_9HYPH|nr:AGE family epimerase/isomerase [Roseibium aggregatum]MBN9670313.1 AGE family epimerase/isomerase [Roseibium aggregatum]